MLFFVHGRRENKQFTFLLLKINSTNKTTPTTNMLMQWRKKVKMEKKLKVCNFLQRV